LYRVSQALTDALAGPQTLLVPSRQSARTLRLAHAGAQLRAGLSTWRSPEILPWGTWLERLLGAATLTHGPLRGFCLLNAAQERALWRRAAALAGAGPGPAERLQRSALLLREHRLQGLLRAQPGSDATAQLLGVLAAFDSLCARERCLAAGMASDEQMQAAAEQLGAPVALAGFAELTARQAWFLEKLAAAGLACAQLAAGTAPAGAATRSVAAADFAAETALLANWSRAQLERDPGCRLLVVAPDLARERATLQRTLATTLAPQRCAGAGELADYLRDALRFEHGLPLVSRPAIEQALRVLALRAPGVEMAQLTAVLNAPFLAATVAPPGTRERLDLWLRDLGHPQFGHAELDHALQFVPAELQAAGGWLRDGLRRLRALLAGPRAGLRAWAERFGAAVDGFGWPGPVVAGEACEGVAEWREALGELAALDAPAGPATDLDCDAAFAELFELLANRELPPALRDAAITLVDRRDLTDRRQAPVVGYDGIWILGVDAGRWPQPAHPDPLLPLAVQCAAGLPQASIANRMAQARTSLAAWTAAGAEVVLSWSLAQGEIAQQPSPLLAEIATSAAPPRGEPPPNLAQRIAAARPLERSAADGGSRWSGMGPLPGGVRTPQLQAECAFHAYAQLRLHAEPLATPAPGITPQVRGALLHRCLELVWTELQGSESLARCSAPQLQSSILGAFERARVELLEREILPPEPRLLERERRRSLRVVLELLELERRRAPFVVHSLEQRELLRVDAAALRFRVDRVDRLADGSTLIIDYKSGSAGSFDPFGTRPQPVQLFAYASALVREQVAALAIVHLGRPVKFVAIADRDDRLPRQRPGPSEWTAQLQTWHGYVEALVRDFLAGTATVDPQPLACRNCHLPALCRIDALRMQDEDPEAEVQDE
jgi:ATP-dependent helicase/nuclease subunit B